MWSYETGSRMPTCFRPFIGSISSLQSTSLTSEYSFRYLKFYPCESCGHWIIARKLINVCMLTVQQQRKFKQGGCFWIPGHLKRKAWFLGLPNLKFRLRILRKESLKLKTTLAARELAGMNSKEITTSIITFNEELQINF